MKSPRRWLLLPSLVARDIDRILGQQRRNAENGLHLGCGNQPIPGLLNCDAFDFSANVLAAAEALPFADSSVDYIEAHHLIEHLGFDDAESALAEWCRVLREGGFLVVSCPDLQALCGRWLRFGLLRFIPGCRSEQARERTLRMFFGSQEHLGMFHRSGYDSLRLGSILEAAGLEVLFMHRPYPIRPTPSLVAVARKNLQFRL
jgi:predicted SAM-dependent methyltransferase